MAKSPKLNTFGRLKQNIKSISAVQTPTPLREERVEITSSSDRLFTDDKSNSPLKTLSEKAFIYSIFLVEIPNDRNSSMVALLIESAVILFNALFVLFQIAERALFEICCPII